MAIRISSLAAQALMTEYGFASMLGGGHICVYSGSQPATADDEPAGVLLGVVTVGGAPVPQEGARQGGLTFDTGPSYGEILDTGDWMLRAVASGTPGWWRAVAYGYAPEGAGTQHIRVDGAVGESLDMGMFPTVTAGQLMAVRRFAARMTPN